MNLVKILGFLLVLLLILYLLGPRPSKPALRPVLPELPDDLRQLEALIRQNEEAIPDIKPDNASQIIWFDSSRTRTEYSLVYLPGFTASHVEAKPVNRDFAQRFGCNLYLPRLHSYGVQREDAMLDFHPDSLLASAAEALAVGKMLGEKVILMGGSTGATLALILAAEFPDIAGLILYAPNIALGDPNAWILSRPWGLQVMRLFSGGKYREYEASEEYKRYWITRYRVEAVVQLQKLLEESMVPETFEKVTQPLFMGYYFKNEEEKDEVVSVAAMREMFEQVGTSKEQKRSIAFPDVGDHVISSYLKSKDLESVRRATFQFAEEVLGLMPVDGK
jgi:pimeloyl-ACP methyl ester carboxylesterase